MKKIGILLLAGIICCLAFSVQAQDITGPWYNDVKDAKIEIYQARNGKYYGKIVWLKFPDRNGKPKLDIKNEEESLRSRPILGLVILSDFVKEGNSYEEGKVYDPKSGHTYSCKMTPEGPDKMNIRGYIGISLIGRTAVWTRASQ